MKPGRKLDALVAEKVRGWSDVRFGEEQTAGLVLGFGVCPSSGMRRAVPSYSTDIAAAWEVFALPLFDAWAVGRRPSDGRYEVFNPFVSYGEVVIVATGDTAPHAICLAALRAVGHVFEEGK